ncbi:36341_t:CDS:2, partial [Gigaspora margarita]
MPGICCSNGKVKLALPEIPVLLQHLLCDENNESKQFRDKIRIYNLIFLFASVGVKLDHELANARTGVYTYHIQGSFYHHIGSLLPESGSDPQYLRITNNTPTVPQVAAIWINEDVPSNMKQKHDIIL